MAKKKENDIDENDLVGEEADKFVDNLIDQTDKQVLTPSLSITRSADGRLVYGIQHETAGRTINLTEQSPAAVLGYIRKALFNGLK